ncbi:ribose 5-phosphate isomerase B [Aridibaculum aurantiacum]|uniref:ribose 5-phosphate isomerase B n=1 Tax=Aridibaculum aurantiacum TaxID=2810307 RepID=UPI001A95D266|nr:ribose 5-phosphate isomerase B [Aridibaculum aurantiacum]
MNLHFDLEKPIAIGADHAGYEYKEALKAYLQEKNLQVTDFGTHSPDSVDYPDFAHPTASSVESEETGFGILVCGSANGVAITANKHAKIRAAICWKIEIAQLARQHNNANILCIPARFVSLDEAKQMVDHFIETRFEGGRHQGRVDKISC